MTLLPGGSPNEARSRSQSQSQPQPRSSPMVNTAQYPSTIAAYLRRGRPSQVQTSFSVQQALPSAAMASVTPSSTTSTSVLDSPIMTSETTSLTTSASSVQPSPDTLSFQDGEVLPPTPFVLSEPVLSREVSTSSSLAHQNMLGCSLPVSDSLPREKSRFIRRRSTATPKVREDSVGPAILRRRSDSNNTVPPEFPAALTSDSEDDIERASRNLTSNSGSPSNLDGFRSANFSIGGPSRLPGLNPGLTVPALLTHGAFITKVNSKKQRRFPLILDAENARLVVDKKPIELDWIREIRTGSDTSQTRLDCGISNADMDRFFSIIYDQSGSKAKTKTFNVLCDDMDTQKNWTKTLDQMIKRRYGQMFTLSAFHDQAVKDYWQTEMSKKFGDESHSLKGERIAFEGIERLCKYLHIWAPHSQLLAKFHVADESSSESLSYSEFLTFAGLMKHRDDVAAIHKLLAQDEHQGVSLHRFLEFLRDTQGEDVDSQQERWKNIFDCLTREAYRPEVEPSQRLMTASQLATYLTSTENSPVAETPKAYQLDRPINEYFISSSHNTYLVGRQVAAESSVEGYIAALLRGCRCVEVDCWDGSDGLPVVKHGYALTTQISFKEVMNTINKYAFEESVFPLWISLEVHCNPIQQEMMAVMIKDAFGSKLVAEPVDPASNELPSPCQLKGRILIKVKKPGEAQSPSCSTGRRRGNSLTSPPVSSPFVRPDSSFAASFPSSPLHSPSQSARNSATFPRKRKVIAEGEVQDSLSCSEAEGSFDGSYTPRKSSHVKIVKALGELGVYNQGIKFNSTLDGPESREPNHIYSLMESTFNRFCQRSKDNKLAIFKHNKTYFMRVYPDQRRIKSNNFDPLIYWRRGVQMCALNWQTYDLPMQLNQAMFAGGTDRSGYVLKPQSLREFELLGVPAETLSTKRPRKQVRFTVEVISAQQLTSTTNTPANKSFDPYVEVEIYHANDKRDKKEDGSSVMSSVENLKACTDVATGNGFNPVFNRKFEFVVTTKFPELIFVRWAVRLSQDGQNPNTNGDRSPPLAVYAAKLLSLKKGYRTLPLYNHQDVYLPCREENSEPGVNVLKSIGPVDS